MFRQDGSWVPDQPINNQNRQGMRSMPQNQMNPVAAQPSQAQTMPQMPYGQIPTSFSHKNFGGVPAGQAASQAIGQSAASMPAPANQMTATQYQAQFLPQALPPPNPQLTQMPMQNASQQVAHNPQAVQDYLRSLQAGKGQSNAWMNAPGAQGQGPQAGFRGFQQNGIPQQFQAQQFHNQQAQLGYTPLQASNGQVMPGTAGQMGGGGVAGQPGFVNQDPVYFGNPNPQPPKYVGGSPRPGNTEGQYEPTQKQQDIEKYNGKPGGNTPEKNSDWGAYSDINVKQEIKTGDTELQEFLDSLGVYSYEYKDAKYGDGRRISPMAQEIEKTPLGKAAISTNEEGYKMVDYGKLGGTMLASLALLNHKYNTLESQLKESIMNGLKNKGKK